MIDIDLYTNRKSISKDLKVIYFEADVSLKEVSTPRPPMDLYVLLDTSKSMEKYQKLEYAKRAITHIFDLMEPMDRLNVIAFSRYANLLGENMGKRDKDPFYENVLKDLKASGNTILSRALLLTKDIITEKSRNSNQAFIEKVILISDGEPTEKNNKTEDFIRYIYKEYSSYSSFLTIGIGPNYNEELLRRIAEVTGGAWMHISTDENIDADITNDIKEMMVSSIYPIKMTFFPSKKVSVEAAYTHKPYVFDLSYFIKNSKEEWGYTFILPSLGKEKQIKLIMKLRANPEIEGPMRIGEINIYDYLNREYSDNISVNVSTNDSEEINPKVRELFFITELMHSASVNVGDKKRIEEIDKKTRIFLSNPNSREEYGHELGKIMTAVQITKTGDLSSEERKKTKILLTNNK